MLALHPNCQLCDRDLAPDATDAMICSYECTFCAACVETVLRNVCPSCGGGFAPRPIRPAEGLRRHPASTTRVNTTKTADAIAALSARLADTPPEKR